MNPNLHTPVATDLKRKRSPSHDTVHAQTAPLQKAAKTHNHLQINYLARQCDNDLPLITNDDTLPNILSLLTDYQGVLDRHESMACNLGARPLGPILIKRFERLFDGPPRVLKSHGKDGTTVTWLDVVEFARNKPEQFSLGQMSEGARVCQFYTKQCRVQISEEDYVLISSGIPQKMIPPQPIIEDEEKELGTLEILEKNLGQICQLADQVAARTRQLNHRLKGRKQAIIDRRATASPGPPARPSSPSNVALMNGTSSQATTTNVTNHTQNTQSSPGGFVAVNSRPAPEQNGHGSGSGTGTGTGNGNGNGASTSTRTELMAKFHTLSDRRPSQPPNGAVEARRPSLGQPPSHSTTPIPTHPKPPPKPVEIGPSDLSKATQMSEAELQSMMTSPVPIPSTPANLLAASSQRANQPQEKDDGGPFKAEMIHRMEALARNERILPPCDRCRRLHMDCLKNLTACMGCTKKHAKCSWKEVRENELRGAFAHPAAMSSGMHSEGEDVESRERASTGSPASMLTPPRQVVTPSLPATSIGPRGVPPEPHATSSRNSPLSIERDRDRGGVEAQLQEAAKSSLAHANARLGAPESKGAEYQTLVA
ncbi:hypothetical protein BDV95DRAFT_488201 [Massariosphaeria phaeospora]|uniref:Zn(2)-C6 fungal-type domain-containing protein n=1 Tax=Massariosphaeria phaeospora TaxID=100035 RepID=A0A7C8MDQ5_9PLEO|nr:hypothetical protein BDV95DRAFT_488201 [Massariosphaeria phaeospora]